ncbi:hypothetical protein C8Q80DRAFT_1121152 [Daedaleopsis nitida]|nr:hypothetical protein C8Q80DRAFT_1121152 [Daedaleopsis nitida]
MPVNRQPKLQPRHDPLSRTRKSQAAWSEGATEGDVQPERVFTGRNVDMNRQPIGQYYKLPPLAGRTLTGRHFNWLLKCRIGLDDPEVKLDETCRCRWENCNEKMKAGELVPHIRNKHLPANKKLRCLWDSEVHPEQRCSLPIADPNKIGRHIETVHVPARIIRCGRPGCGRTWRSDNYFDGTKHPCMGEENAATLNHQENAATSDNQENVATSSDQENASTSDNQEDVPDEPSEDATSDDEQTVLSVGQSSESDDDAASVSSSVGSSSGASCDLSDIDFESDVDMEDVETAEEVATPITTPDETDESTEEVEIVTKEVKTVTKEVQAVAMEVKTVAQEVKVVATVTKEVKKEEMVCSREETPDPVERSGASDLYFQPWLSEDDDSVEDLERPLGHSDFEELDAFYQ